MPHQEAEVLRDSTRLQPIEVVRHTLPLVIEAIEVTVGGRALLEPRSPDRRRRVAAIAADLERDPLPDRAVGRRLNQEVIIGVRVDVHEAGREREAGRLDDPPSSGAVDLTNLRDPVASHGEIGPPRLRPGPVDQVGPSDYQVIHGVHSEQFIVQSSQFIEE
ncbi:MAG: hypothetical protein HW376_1703 [candidate division NC10 bacterium]|nr:hypothetical protein [candidate division NC10 bacterium]